MTRKLVPSLLLSVLLLISFNTGCRQKTNTSTTDSDSSASDSAGSSYSSSSSSSSASSSSSQASDVSTAGNGLTVSSVGGNVNTDNSTESTNPVAAGTTSAQKLPDFCYTLASGKLSCLGATDDTNTAEYQAKAALFETLTGTKLEWNIEITGYNDLTTRLAARVMSGDAPDVFEMPSGTSAWLVRKNYFQPVTNFVNPTDALMGDYLNDNIKPLVTYQGVQYAVPLATQANLCIYYNKDMLADSELEDPMELYKQGKWTWDALYSYVKELTVTTNGVTQVYGLSMTDHMTQAFFASTGQDIVTMNADGTVSNNLRNSSLTEAADMIYKIGQISHDPVTWEVSTNFPNGSVAMFTDYFPCAGNDAINAMRKAGKVGVVPFPKESESSSYYSRAGCQLCFFCKGAQNCEAYAAWLYFRSYLEKNPSTAVTEARNKTYTDEYGYDMDAVNLITSHDSSCTPIYMCGDQIPDFSAKTSLWNDVFTTPWSTLVEALYPSLQQAIDAQG